MSFGRYLRPEQKCIIDVFLRINKQELKGELLKDLFTGFYWMNLKLLPTAANHIDLHGVVMDLKCLRQSFFTKYRNGILVACGVHFTAVYSRLMGNKFDQTCPGRLCLIMYKKF